MLGRTFHFVDGAAPATPSARRSTLTIPGVLASEVRPEKVHWLWENHFPLGKVAIIDGDPEKGKSLYTLDLAARLSRGDVMPDGSQGRPTAGAVIVSTEDGTKDTIRPRLEVAGADLTKVRIISTITGPDEVARTPTIPGDLAEIELAIRDVNAALLVFDPLVGVLDPKINCYRDQDIRRALAPVEALAERTGVAAICLRHLNKTGGLNPMYRGGGSIGIIGAARAAFLFGAAPGRENVYVMAPNKGNLWRKRPPAFEFKIEERELEIEGERVTQPVIVWRGESELTARDLLTEPESAEAKAACAVAK